MNPPGVPSRWLVLEVPRPEDPERSALVVEALMDLAGHGVEERDDQLVVYLPESDDPEQVSLLLESLTRQLAPLLDTPTDEEDAAPFIHHRWQSHEDWKESWREGLGPRRIGDRLVVSPPWSEVDLREGEILLTIDPGMAFGTAEHPTTRGCLRLLESQVNPGDRLADVGTGSGILAIAALRLGADHVVALEIEPWSCEAARANAEINGVSDGLEIREERVGLDFLPGEAPFDGIMANIESGVLLPRLPGLRRGLGDGGWLVLSGILLSEVESIRSAAEEAELEFEAEDREEEWWSGVFRAR
jgi:ribosomal protein L11 methyltransferase